MPFKKTKNLKKITQIKIIFYKNVVFMPFKIVQKNV